MLADELRGQRRKSIALTRRPAEFGRYVAALDIIGFAQAHTERPHTGPIQVERSAAEVSDHWHRRLLRPRRERPRGRRAAECGQQFPPADGGCPMVAVMRPFPREVRKTQRYHATSVLSPTARHPARGLFSLVDDSRTGYPPRALFCADGAAQC